LNGQATPAFTRFSLPRRKPRPGRPEERCSVTAFWSAVQGFQTLEIFGQFQSSLDTEWKFRPFQPLSSFATCKTPAECRIEKYAFYARAVRKAAGDAKVKKPTAQSSGFGGTMVVFSVQENITQLYPHIYLLLLEQFPLKNVILQGFSLKNRGTCLVTNRVTKQV
jgi:hypothetical protein